jgi:hypothetical protein
MSWLTQRQVLIFRHLAGAAFREISFRRWAVSFFAQARPPFRAQSFPRATAAWFFLRGWDCGCLSGASVVDYLTTCRAF